MLEGFTGDAQLGVLENSNAQLECSTGVVL